MKAGLGGGRRAMAAILLALSAPTWAQAQDRPTTAMDGQWHFNLAPYMWMSGVKGNISVASLAVPVDASFSDILERRQLDLAYSGPRVWFAYSW